MKVKRVWTYLLACTMLACTLNDTDPILKRNIESKMTDSSAVLDFAAETDFDWDEMIILSPYSRHEDIEAEHGIELTRSENSPIQSFDHYNLVVFLKENKEVAYVELDRKADFEDVRVLISREDAGFKLQDEKMRLIAK